MMVILFSPVGTADPITTLGDGPMLHIVRHCRPEFVMLFFSPKMAEYEDLDHRYTRSIERLSAEGGWPCPEIELVRSNYDDVFRFDYYIDEFEGCLRRLSEKAAGDPVLLNGSSGTPAMEQALASLSSFGRLSVSLLQVLTPRHDVNERHDRENPRKYDFDTLWELNTDNEEKAASRIVEVSTPNFSDRLLRECVLSLVNRYDYEASFGLLRQMSVVDTDAADLICATADRLNLSDSEHANAFVAKKLPARRKDALAEYLSVMEVRLEQGHYAEFIRLITPALTELIKRRLDLVLPRGNYLKREKNGGYTDILYYPNIEHDEELKVVLGVCGQDNRRPRFISNSQLINLYQHYCANDMFQIRIEAIRKAEENARHRLAHTITSSGRKDIEDAIGMTLEDVLVTLFELHGKAQRGLYRQINEKIGELLC